MAAYRKPGPIGLDLESRNLQTSNQGIKGFGYPPGSISTAYHQERPQKALNFLPGGIGSIVEQIPKIHSEYSQSLYSFGESSIDTELRRKLLTWANYVPLKAPKDKTVFYHGRDGGPTAEAFVNKDPSYKRLDDILGPDNDRFVELLELHDRDFKSAEEIWWELSVRLAENAIGDVWVFGGGVYKEGHDLSNGNMDGTKPEQFRSQFDHRSGDPTKITYLDTVFDKVELPALMDNREVSIIYYNEVATYW